MSAAASFPGGHRSAGFSSGSSAGDFLLTKVQRRGGGRWEDSSVIALSTRSGVWYLRIVAFDFCGDRSTARACD